MQAEPEKRKLEMREHDEEHLSICCSALTAAEFSMECATLTPSVAASICSSLLKQENETTSRRKVHGYWG